MWLVRDWVRVWVWGWRGWLGWLGLESWVWILHDYKSVKVLTGPNVCVCVSSPWFFSGKGIVSLSLLRRFFISLMSLNKMTEIRLVWIFVLLS